MSTLTLLGGLALPAMVAAAALCLLLSRRALSDAFLRGARDGMRTAASLLPALCMLMVGCTLFRRSGLCDFLCDLLSPLCMRIGFPPEVLPFLLLRPVSGSASTAMLQDLFQSAGPDSFAAVFASVVYGSSDTLLYVLSLYFSAAGVRRTRYAFPAAFVTLLLSLGGAFFFARWFYGSLAGS